MIVVAVVAVAVIIILVWVRCNNQVKAYRQKCCDSIKAELKNAIARLDFQVFEEDTYPVIVFKCDPKVWDWMRCLNMSDKRCSLLLDQYHNTAINAGIIQASKEAVDKLFQRYLIAPEYAYLFKVDDGIKLVFHQPILNALELKLIRLWYKDEKLAQIPITAG